MLTFDTYIIRPLERSDLKPYFHLVDKNRKRLENFFTGTVSRTKDEKATQELLEEIVLKR